MSNLLSSLRSAADTLDALQQSVAVSQNNVMNASTPGYVRQTLPLAAREFLPGGGFLGGVETGTLKSSRDEYAEQAVRTQVTEMGKASQQVRSLTSLESVFPINDAAGISASWDHLLQSFSALSATPNNVTAQKNVLSAAGALSNSFQRTADQLTRVTNDTNQEIQGTVAELNAVVSRVREYNQRRQSGAGEDASLDAQMHNAFEELSQLADVKAVKVADGTYTLLLNGQHAILIGTRQNQLASQLVTPTTPAPVNAGAAPNARVVDITSGEDVSEHVQTGKLGGLLTFRNETLTEYQGDSQATGLLNKVAASLADRVNGILSPATPLFTYDATSSVKTALSIAVNPAADLSALPADAAGVSNGKLLQLAGLANPLDPNDRIDGMSYAAFFGYITSTVGQKLSDAKVTDDSQTQLVDQAKALRTQLSGISLDEEATRLVEFQRAYEATSRMVAVLNEMNDAVMGLIR